MKDGIRLRIGEQWAVLPDDINISIEMTSPLWNESGTFSYSFEIPYSANCHLFGMASLPETNARLNNFREKFELYVEGVCLLHGDIVCSSEEVDTDNDSIDMELRSDLSVFEDAIKDASVQDLSFDMLIADWTKNQDASGYTSEIMTQKFYVHSSYPQHPFINIPMVVNSEKKTMDGVNEVLEKKPLLLSPYRSYSSPCFFLLYVYDRIMEHSGFHITNDDPLKKIDDLHRIIILNNKFATRWSKQRRYTTPQGNTVWRSSLYLTEKNLPDIKMTEFISMLKNAFGFCLIPDGVYGMKGVMYRDLFHSTETLELNIEEVLSVNRKHVPFTGIKVTYGQGEGTEFNYNEYKNVQVKENYKAILDIYHQLLNQKDEDGYSLADSDTTLYISKETGNFYRVKVDKDTGSGASLFEVGQFNDYTVDADPGNKDEEPEEVELGFAPFVPTNVNSDFFHFNRLYNNSKPRDAFFVNVQVDWNVKVRIKPGSAVVHRKSDGECMDMNYAADGEMCRPFNHAKAWERMKCIDEQDIPFTLGVMRNSTTGEQGNYVEVIKPNADGFGNDEWINTASYDTLTADSVTHDGKVFDYNGSEPGIGVDLKNLVSLKLWNCKKNFNPDCLSYTDEDGKHHDGKTVYDNNPTGALPYRGLVPQFLAEYIYFCQHRRPLEIVVYMGVSELLNIQWDKYYRILGYRCLLNKISFDISQDGIGKVTMEVYMI